jgi:hypothetical protein
MKTVAFCTILSLVLLLASCADAPTESETEAVASTVAADQSAPPPAALTPDGSAPATAGVASSSSASSPPVLAAGAACPKPVSGTACATPYGTAYPGGDRTQPRCVVCYDTDSVGPGLCRTGTLGPSCVAQTPTPPTYRTQCLGTLTSSPSTVVNCVADCTGCS